MIIGEVHRLIKFIEYPHTSVAGPRTDNTGRGSTGNSDEITGYRSDRLRDVVDLVDLPGLSGTEETKLKVKISELGKISNLLTTKMFWNLVVSHLIYWLKRSDNPTAL